MVSVVLCLDTGIYMQIQLSVASWLTHISWKAKTQACFFAREEEKLQDHETATHLQTTDKMHQTTAQLNAPSIKFSVSKMTLSLLT